MLNNSIVQVAIGLIFVFSLMAILVTQVNNIVTILLNMRARQLKRGLKELITDEQIQAKILAHPLINMVKITVTPDIQLTAQAVTRITNAETSRVAYIQPWTFVEALTGVLIAQSDTDLYRRLHRAIEAMPNSVEKSKLREDLRLLRANFSEQTVRDIYAIIDQIPDEPTRTNLIFALQEFENAIGKLQFKGNELVPLINGINNIEDPRFKSALQTILVNAQSLGDARDRLENWFNEGMGRVSDTYKRRMQAFSLVSAFFLALVINVDTLFLSRSLWEDDEMRRTLAQAAIEFDTSTPPVVIVPDEESTVEELEAEVADARDTIQRLLDLQLPVGWQFTSITTDMVETSLELGLPNPLRNPRNVWNFWPGNSEHWLSLWLYKLVGLLVTTIAAAQGAPFWFDLLNRMRSSSKSDD